jgi:hypothetical protein
MRPYAIRLLTLAAGATAAVAVGVVTSPGGEAMSRHIRKHHQRMSPGWTESWAAQDVRTAPSSHSFADSPCPGNARSIDCNKWPPPFDDDADRKSGDGGGG